jgi:hypothetical protein
LHAAQIFGVVDSVSVDATWRSDVLDWRKVGRLLIADQDVAGMPRGGAVLEGELEQGGVVYRYEVDLLGRLLLLQ